MKVGDRGYLIPPDFEHWSVSEPYHGRLWTIRAINTMLNTVELEAKDNPETNDITIWFHELADLWSPLDSPESDSPEACKCPSAMLWSAGHNPTCSFFNSYRRTKEPWKYR